MNRIIVLSAILILSPLTQANNEAFDVVNLECLSHPELSGKYLSNDHGVDSGLYIIGKKISSQQHIVSGPEKLDCPRSVSLLRYAAEACLREDKALDAMRVYETRYSTASREVTVGCSDGSKWNASTEADVYRQLIRNQ